MGFESRELLTMIRTSEPSFANLILQFFLYSLEFKLFKILSNILKYNLIFHLVIVINFKQNQTLFECIAQKALDNYRSAI